MPVQQSTFIHITSGTEARVLMQTYASQRNTADDWAGGRPMGAVGGGGGGARRRWFGAEDGGSETDPAGCNFMVPWHRLC